MSGNPQPMVAISLKPTLRNSLVLTVLGALKGAAVYYRVRGADVMWALIRSRGHVPKAGYDVPNAQEQTTTGDRAGSSMGVQSASRSLGAPGRQVGRRVARDLALTESALRHWVEPRERIRRAAGLGSGDRCTTDVPGGATQPSHSGSIYGVGD